MRPLFDGASLPSCPSVPTDDMNDQLQGLCRRRVGFRIPEHGVDCRVSLARGANLMARIGSERSRAMPVTKYSRAITAVGFDVELAIQCGLLILASHRGTTLSGDGDDLEQMAAGRAPAGLPLVPSPK